VSQAVDSPPLLPPGLAIGNLALSRSPRVPAAPNCGVIRPANGNDIDVMVPASPQMRCYTTLCHATTRTPKQILQTDAEKLRLPGTCSSTLERSCALASLLTMHLAATKIATAHQRRFGTSAQIYQSNLSSIVHTEIFQRAECLFYSFKRRMIPGIKDHLKG
jgi:hypothetical protein